jgi:hypothetical protein
MAGFSKDGAAWIARTTVRVDLCSGVAIDKEERAGKMPALPDDN